MTVEKGIPIPPPKPRGRKLKYDFSVLKEVGDSMFFASDEPEEHVIKVTNAASHWGHRHGILRWYTARAVENGVRIWKIK